MLKVQESHKGIWLENVQDFQLEKIFESGQTFRFHKMLKSEKKAKEDDRWLCGYEGVACNSYLQVQEYARENSKGRNILLSGISYMQYKKVWENFFDMKRNYGALRRMYIKAYPNIKDAVAEGRGLRILKQDPVETIFTFILSANNHFARIRHGINTLCELSGEQIITPSGQVYYTSPDANQVATLSEEELSQLKSGYRQPYIRKAAEMIASKRVNLQRIIELSSEEGSLELQKLPGVGPKVADCILLFAFQKYDVFPVDTWIRQAMEQRFSGNEDLSKENRVKKPMKEKDIRLQGRALFGETAGIAQQYLFYGQRAKKALKP